MRSEVNGRGTCARSPRLTARHSGELREDQHDQAYENNDHDEEKVGNNQFALQ